MYHDWWPYKWTSCWACVVRNQNYITATFWESIVQYLSVFNVKYTPTVHGKCINFPLLKGCSWNNHPYPFQIKVLSVSRKIGTITKENHCILIDISCVNIFKSNIYIYINCALQMHQFWQLKVSSWNNQISYRRSLVFSRDDWAVTYGREMPEMKLMKGIYDRPRNDDYDERKRPTDGCPTPWRHCRTRHVSGSWNRQRNLAKDLSWHMASLGHNELCIIKS